MDSIIFFDLETNKENNSILDIGCISNNGTTFHRNSLDGFLQFISNFKYICGHNIINHDLKILIEKTDPGFFNHYEIIDTLLLSPILFPKKPYHRLLKDEKLQPEESNNPLNDSIKARDLLFDEVSAFNLLDDDLKNILFFLLVNESVFRSFFKLVSFSPKSQINISDIIYSRFKDKICRNSNLLKYIKEYPVELAYCLALINCCDKYSITPPWVLRSFPHVERIMHLLRSNPCLNGCDYCNKFHDPYNALNRYFGFSRFREYGGKPLQYEAVMAAICNKSILVIFPTGGGKSLTFQIPALMAGETNKGLTVVISPLQSLMKDQVDNLESKGVTEAVTINGLLDPIERAKSIERVRDGSASILYLSPESLRSKTIEKLFLERKLERFVIDEAHCFSSWGQDFRVDYLYIGRFIRSLQEKKGNGEKIPVSCFTATAKPRVIEDIKSYFKEELGIELQLYTSRTGRTNLTYNVLPNASEEQKYYSLRNLIDSRDCPIIVYVSRTSKARKLAEKLNDDGFSARAFHGKMDAKEKSENQDAFKNDDVKIIVATSAFGMGVDKPDVGIVIHYDISDSLENYIQEAGRAGRDENISADCFILYNEEDLGKHFTLLNQTKIDIKEINQVWKAIKDITRTKSKISNSALEIARKAGWDENIKDIETRITTAIAALEEAKYLRRGQNEPRVYANSILSKTAQDAIDKINSSDRFDESQKIKAIRIIRHLISAKSRKYATDEAAESRVDYIADNLGIVKEDIFRIITILKEEKILGDSKDLSAFIKEGDTKEKSIRITESFVDIEKRLFREIEENEKTYNIKELNETLASSGCSSASTDKIRRILNFWSIKNWIRKLNKDYSKDHIVISISQSKKFLEERLGKRHHLAGFIIEYLYKKVKDEPLPVSGEKPVEFSVLELKDAYENNNELFKHKITSDYIEDTLFYLSRIEALKLEGGFLVVYNRLTIEKLEKGTRVQYKKDDYRKLQEFYDNKIEQIHIVGEYAKKMIEDYHDALHYVDDYFNLNYPIFLNKYFKGERQSEIKNSITPAKFRELTGTLSLKQLSVIRDHGSQYIVVAAGPGSGKTKLLVHKLASLLMLEDVKHEQLLMLTFSRAAATEFKKRLTQLYGNASNFVEIKTFHSYCFDLLGRVGTLGKSDEIISSALMKIGNGEIEQSKITKTVLVIDEAQDMDQSQYELIKILIEKNDDLKIIAVGDDDQNIYSFRKSDSKYMSGFLNEPNASLYELIQNFRSRKNLVYFTNLFAKTIPGRLKTSEIFPVKNENGEIKIIRYSGGNMIIPLIKDLLSSDLSGSTCIMTFTNDDAVIIAGLLNREGIKSKLIHTSDSFDLVNLKEVRFLMNYLKDKDVPIIADEKWKSAMKELEKEFAVSSNIPLCWKLLKEFEAANTRVKYYSDFLTFVYESTPDDFTDSDSETVYISTMHKSKGREFSNVFLMLPDFNISTPEGKRLLYVAMTRAKDNLTIHYNGNYFDEYQNIENLNHFRDFTEYEEPDIISLQLNHTDINLGYFKFVQKRLIGLRAGQKLLMGVDECKNDAGETVLKFSKSFMDKSDKLRKKGYELSEARLQFIVYWKGKDAETEILILLPEISFHKKNKTSSRY
jgi:ATP-dependent DNA helicase RecQ